MLCFDNCDEFAPREFNAFHELHGITQQFLIPNNKTNYQNEKNGL